MARRSLWQRFTSAVERFFTGGETAPVEPPIESAPPIEPRGFRPLDFPDEAEERRERERFRFFTEEVPPELSGIPPTYQDYQRESNHYDYTVEGMGLGGEAFETWTGEWRDSDYARDLLYTGWYDDNASPDDRKNARAEFFDYTEVDYADFDWDDWRDWYEATH